MSTAANNYKRLPGRGHQLAGYYQLYRGSDHLLQISFAGYNERYKRFFFRDIQAFIVIPTTTWLIYLSLCAMGFLAMLGIAFAVNDTAGNYTFGTLAGICLVAGVWQVLAGQTCRCYVRTAVQMEHLPSLGRIRRAQKIIAALQPLIAASQAPLATAAPAAEPETFTPPAEPQPPVP